MTVRPVIEIQRAHDMIVAIMLKEVPNPGFDEKYLHCAADVLCWALQHDHNMAFTENLLKLEAALLDLGFALENKSN